MGSQYHFWSSDWWFWTWPNYFDDVTWPSVATTCLDITQKTNSIPTFVECWQSPPYTNYFHMTQLPALWVWMKNEHFSEYLKIVGQFRICMWSNHLGWKNVISCITSILSWSTSIQICIMRLMCHNFPLQLLVNFTYLVIPCAKRSIADIQKQPLLLNCYSLYTMGEFCQSVSGGTTVM